MISLSSGFDGEAKERGTWKKKDIQPKLKDKDVKLGEPATGVRNSL